jgi:hypothetical protein
MSFFRKDTSVDKDRYSTPEKFYSEIRSGLREKANHNKKESELAFFCVIVFTLVAPLFVTLGEGMIWGKLVPACLSVAAAAATSWLQIRKPQRLWALYRRAQRELEREKSAFDFQLGDYALESDREKLLAQRVSEIAFSVHEQWEGLVPDPDALVSNKALNVAYKPESNDERT